MQKSREGLTPSGGRCRRQRRKLGLTWEQRWSEEEDERDPEAFMAIWAVHPHDHCFAVCSNNYAPVGSKMKRAHKCIRSAYRDELRDVIKLHCEQTDADLIDEEFDPHKRLRARTIFFQYHL